MSSKLMSSLTSLVTSKFLNVLMSTTKSCCSVRTLRFKTIFKQRFKNAHWSLTISWKKRKNQFYLTEELLFLSSFSITFLAFFPSVSSFFLSLSNFILTQYLIKRTHLLSLPLPFVCLYVCVFVRPSVLLSAYHPTLPFKHKQQTIGSDISIKSLKRKT